MQALKHLPANYENSHRLYIHPTTSNLSRHALRFRMSLKVESGKHYGCKIIDHEGHFEHTVKSMPAPKDAINIVLSGGTLSFNDALPVQ